MTAPNEYWCGCQCRLVTDCRCMRGYRFLQRLGRRIRAMLGKLGITI